MVFRILVASANRAILVQPLSSLFSRSIPFAAVRWNSSAASEWANRKPNFLLSTPRIRSILTTPTTENISYTEKLEKLREGFIDNSDLQSPVISLFNIPSMVIVERVREYVSKFGAVVECDPSGGRFRVKFSSHQEAKNAVETINSATEYPIDVGFGYTIKLPLLADYAPPNFERKVVKPSRTIMVKMYAGEAQAVVDTFAKHATVVSFNQTTTDRHGVSTSSLFVAFNDIQDAEKVLNSLDGKVTVDDHQYELVYGRERAKPFTPNRPVKPNRPFKPKRPFSRRNE